MRWYPGFDRARVAAAEISIYEIEGDRSGRNWGESWTERSARSQPRRHCRHVRTGQTI
jgi:hypothetical protein